MCIVEPVKAQPARAPAEGFSDGGVGAGYGVRERFGYTMRRRRGMVRKSGHDLRCGAAGAIGVSGGAAVGHGHRTRYASGDKGKTEFLPPLRAKAAAAGKIKTILELFQLEPLFGHNRYGFSLAARK
ncbi:hypothetical protein EVAR_65012_1 [Eumeta japonica]|uniref:Uncharacterized protein n=1 Tax=Eumeta variegata TaxID=151549 RepID=A0A4C2ABI2_EUMVA|nr:hypothetical protein EVAR_65012_1 [Eumeta japonica]